MSISKAKNERVDIRLNSEHKEALLRAAAVQGLSLSEFIVARSLEAAHEVIRRHTVITMTPRDLDRFVRALDEDASPNEALKEAAKAHRAKERKARAAR